MGAAMVVALLVLSAASIEAPKAMPRQAAVAALVARR